MMAIGGDCTNFCPGGGYEYLSQARGELPPDELWNSSSGNISSCIGAALKLKARWVPFFCDNSCRNKVHSVLFVQRWSPGPWPTKSQKKTPSIAGSFSATWVMWAAKPASNEATLYTVLRRPLGLGLWGKTPWAIKFQETVGVKTI